MSILNVFSTDMRCIDSCHKRFNSSIARYHRFGVNDLENGVELWDPSIEVSTPHISKVAFTIDDSTRRCLFVCTEICGFHNLHATSTSFHHFAHTQLK